MSRTFATDLILIITVEKNQQNGKDVQEQLDCAIQLLNECWYILTISAMASSMVPRRMISITSWDVPTR